MILTMLALISIGLSIYLYVELKYAEQERDDFHDLLLESMDSGVRMVKLINDEGYDVCYKPQGQTQVAYLKKSNKK